MDIVYVCRTGQNEELRYSLRSAVAHIPHSRLWLFGGWPSWFVSESAVPVEQRKSAKHANAEKVLRAALDHPDVSERFVMMNDDFFAMTPEAGSIEPLDLGPLDDVIARYESDGIRSSRYFCQMKSAAEILRSLGVGRPLSFEAHIPMVFEKARLRSILDRFGEPSGVTGCHYRTLYGNLHRVSSRTIEDVKLYDATMPIPRGPFASSLDGKPFEAMLPVLRYLFPEPSVYERPEPQPECVNGIKYPVRLAHDCTLDGVTYKQGERVFRNVAIALKATGQLRDPRIM